MTSHAYVLIMVIVFYYLDSVVVVDFFNQEMEFCRLNGNVHSELNRYFLLFRCLKAYFQAAWPPLIK